MSALRRKCPECGKVTRTIGAYCPYCATKLTPEVIVVEESESKQKKFGWIPIIGIVAIVAIVAMFFWHPWDNKCILSNLSTISTDELHVKHITVDKEDVEKQVVKDSVIKKQTVEKQTVIKVTPATTPKPTATPTATPKTTIAPTATPTVTPVPTPKPIVINDLSQHFTSDFIAPADGIISGDCYLNGKILYDNNEKTFLVFSVKKGDKLHCNWVAYYSNLINIDEMKKLATANNPGQTPQK